MELNEEIFEKARQIVIEYPIPPDSITKSDARTMMKDASIQLAIRTMMKDASIQLAKWIVCENSFLDWEAIRVNAATNTLAGLVSNARPEIAIDTDFDTLVAQSVQLADKLIEKLKEKQNEKAI